MRVLVFSGLLAVGLLTAGCGPSPQANNGSASQPTANAEASTDDVDQDSHADSMPSAQATLDSAIAAAKTTDKKLLVHFGADW